MENEQLFEVGETYAFKSDLFGAPVKGEIEKVYENSVMIRVINCSEIKCCDRMKNKSIMEE